MPPLRLALWSTSAAGVFLGVLAIAGSPVPVAWCVAGLLVHFALATVGVLLPSLGVFADVLTRGSSGRAEVALTFDDGPHPETTRRVLELLRKHDTLATFFVLGAKAAKYPELVREIHAAGHEIGVHGHEHDRLYALRSARSVTRDLEHARRAVEAAVDVRVELFRPPVGFVGPGVACGAAYAGLTLVGFSARARDGLAGAQSDAVLARVTSALEPGAIIVLHDAAERDDRVPASLAVLDSILQRMRERGLRGVTVSEVRQA